MFANLLADTYRTRLREKERGKRSRCMRKIRVVGEKHFHRIIELKDVNKSATEMERWKCEDVHSSRVYREKSFDWKKSIIESGKIKLDVSGIAITSTRNIVEVSNGSLTKHNIINIVRS